MNCWNSSLACAAPPPEGPTPPSSAYWVHRSLSTISAHSANCKSATSPGESLLLLDLFSALPSVARSVPADSAAPAIPIPFKNERRSTTRCQRESRVSIGSVAVSVETVVEKFSFFTSPTLRSWIVLCNPAKCKTPPCGRYFPNQEIFFLSPSGLLTTSKRECLKAHVITGRLSPYCR